MEVADFCSTSRVVIVAGKGGVGKTTVTAALAVTAARAGRSALIVEVEGKSGLPTMFGVSGLGYDDIDLEPGIRARFLTPDAALVDYLVSHGMKRISKRLVASGALEVVATAVPGMKDILVLGKVKQLEDVRAADLVIVDAPAAGHAITFLLSARGLLDAVRVGPVRKQAQDVVDLLSDPQRCQVLLVTMPEETPVSEVIETAFAIEDRAGVALGPVVVNGCFAPLPEYALTIAADAQATSRFVSDREADDLAHAAAFRRERHALQRVQVDRLRARLPLPQIELPFVFTPDITRPQLDELADALTLGIEGFVKVEELVDSREVVICCGSGGVGKTTTAAVIALEGARRGRNACVVTIDPARRLADALGLEHLSDEPSEIDRARWADAHSVPGGRLSALMLDTKSTFDRLVTTNATTDEQRQRILENRFYRNVSGALGGTQEYMAMEKLYELHTAGGFDLIVVDTPPTRHALDFLDAPARLTRLLDNRIFRLLMAPTRAGMRVASVAVQTFLKTVARVVGAEVIRDIVTFFRAFEGMEAGFRERAQAVGKLLADPATAFVLVTSPRRDALEEATFFAARLREADQTVEALIINRVHPSFGDESPAGLRAAANALRGDGSEPAQRLAALYDNLADFRQVALLERAHLDGLRTTLGGGAAVAFVPYLAHDVYDFAALREIGTLVFAPDTVPVR